MFTILKRDTVISVCSKCHDKLRQHVFGVETCAHVLNGAIIEQKPRHITLQLIIFYI